MDRYFSSRLNCLLQCCMLLQHPKLLLFLQCRQCRVWDNLSVVSPINCGVTRGWVMIILYMASSPDIILHHHTSTNTLHLNTTMQWSRFLLDESTKEETRDNGSVFPSLRQVMYRLGTATFCPDVLLPATLLYLDIRRPGPCTGPGPYSRPVCTSHNINILYRNMPAFTPKIIVFDSDTQSLIYPWHGLIFALRSREDFSVAAGRIHRHRQPRDEGLLRLCGGVMVVMVACQQQSQYSDSAQTKPQNSTSHLRSNTVTPPRCIPTSHYTTAGWWGFNYVKK